MSELKKLKKLLQSGRISRREFMSRTAAMGLTVAASPLLFAGVSRAATPRKGGTLKVGIDAGSASDSIHPEKVTDISMFYLVLQLRNCLTEIDVNNQIIPELAESWDVSRDAKTWTFNLRKGVEFHNGKTFDADDVKFSINLHRGEESKSPEKATLDTIEDIKVVDKHTVQFILKAGNMDFPAYLVSPNITMVIADTTDFSIGTGGYILEKFEPGVISITNRNPNYWKAGRAHFDRIEMKKIGDVAARTTALRTGVIDVMNKVDLRTANLLKQSKDIQVLRSAGKRFFSMAMLTDVPPYNNNDARLALKYAIDREHIVKTILAGYGSVGNDHPITEAYPFFNPDLPQRTYNPDKARFHLKKAGLESHVFKLHSSDGAHKGAVDTALLFEQHAAKAGIELEVVREPSDGYWSEVWLKKPFCQVYWSGRPTEDYMLTTMFQSEAAWNDTHFKNARFDQMLKAARTEQDQQKRREMYGEMQGIIRDEGGTIIPVLVDYVDAASKRVKFAQLANSYEMDGMRFAERWWFES